MATTLTSSVNVSVQGTYTNTLDFNNAVASLNRQFTDSLANGTGDDQSDLIFWDQRSVVNPTPDDLDLAGGLTDAYGNSLTFARIKCMYVRNNDGTNDLAVGGAAANAFVNWVADATDKVNLKPGGMMTVWAPGATAYAVTAGTGDILRLDASAGTISYDIVLIGSSA